MITSRTSATGENHRLLGEILLDEACADGVADQAPRHRVVCIGRVLVQRVRDSGRAGRVGDPVVSLGPIETLTESVTFDIAVTRLEQGQACSDSDREP